MEVKFSQQMLEKIVQIPKCHINPSVRCRVVPCGLTDVRTDGPDETDSRFLQYCAPARTYTRTHVHTQKQFIRFNVEDYKTKPFGSPKWKTTGRDFIGR